MGGEGRPMVVNRHCKNVKVSDMRTFATFRRSTVAAFLLNVL